MLLLLSLMTENNFWTSEQRLLTTNWQKHFFHFNEYDEPNMKDILLSREQAQIPVICVKRRLRKRGQRTGCFLRLRRRSNIPPLPSVLLANMQSLENKIDDL